MQVLNTKNELISLLENLRKEGKKIGFVPTMGALHEGHLSLVKESKHNSDITVVSIFVNPTQFNDQEDLKRYPRTLEKDIELLKTAGCDIVFAPSVEEIYPEPDTRKFDFGYLETVMEGAKRPGHFNGVGQVVSRLFDIVSPQKAFFGMKDFQQVAIIKNMVQQLKYDVEIIPCPIIREEDGLAKSSRNTYLSAEERKAALILSQTIKMAKELVAEGEKDAEVLVAKMKKNIEKEPLAKIDYVKAVNGLTMQQQKEIKAPMLVAMAVYIGKTRLIDNMIISEDGQCR